MNQKGINYTAVGHRDAHSDCVLDLVSALQLQNSPLNTENETSFHIQKVKPGPLEDFLITHMRERVMMLNIQIENLILVSQK